MGAGALYRESVSLSVQSHRTSRLDTVLVWILLLAAVLRGAVALFASLHAGSTAVFHMPDSQDYLALARNWITTGTFTLRDNLPEIARTPGYPLILIPGILLGHVDAVTIAVQIAVSSTVVLMVYDITLIACADRAAARLAALLYALDPQAIAYCSVLISETAFAALLTALILLLCVYLRARRRRDLVSAAVVLSMAAYVRPIAYFLPILLSGFLLLSGSRHSRQRLWPAVLFLMVAFIPLGAWQLRNWSQARYAGFSALMEDSLYHYHAQLVAQWVHEPLPPLALREHSAAKFAFERQAGLRMLERHPGVSAMVYITGLARTAFAPNPILYGTLLGIQLDDDVAPPTWRGTGVWQTLVSLYRSAPGVFVVGAIFQGVLGFQYLLVLIGLPRWRTAASRLSLVLLLVVGTYLLLLSGGGTGSGRLRQPLIPIVCVLAAQAVVRDTRGRRLHSAAIRISGAAWPHRR